MSKYTAKNLDSYVGETVTVSNGFFSVSPWGYQMPLTSNRFGLQDVPNGTYKITEKVAESSADGAAVTYTIES
jgi:hypothetical protein